jgi:hypothetical protein
MTVAGIIKHQNLCHGTILSRNPRRFMAERGRHAILPPCEAIMRKYDCKDKALMRDGDGPVLHALPGHSLDRGVDTPPGLGIVPV